MLELIHAWEDQREGGAGFATVYRTEGMSPATTGLLEQYSGMQLSSQDAMPPVLAHRIVLVDGVACSVLTCITQNEGLSPDRPVRTAHHLVLTPSERPASGPVPLLLSNWFCRDWARTSSYPGGQRPAAIAAATPGPLQAHSDWLALLARRVSSHTATTVIPLQGDHAADIVAAVEHDLSPAHRWTFTFLTGTESPPDGVLLVIAPPATAAATKRITRADGVTLKLTPTPPDTATASQTSPPIAPEIDRVELISATMQPANTTFSLPLTLLVVVAIGVIALVIAAAGGWLP